MKIIYYAKDEQKLLTNSEFEEAKEFFMSGTKYFCARTNDFLSPNFRFTMDRNLEDRFKALIYRENDGRNIKVLYDFRNNLYYKLPEGYEFQDSYENIVSRERGEDIMTYGILPKTFTSEEIKAEFLSRSITEDEYIDNGNSLETNNGETLMIEG